MAFLILNKKNMALNAMRVPTIFTAKDSFSSVVRGMTKNTKTFGAGIDILNKRVNNAFNSVGGMAVTGGVGSLFFTAGRDVVEYEKAVASLGAVTGTVVGSMKGDIESLGFESNRSVIDIAKGFEQIGSKMSEYLKNPTALREIAKQSILMADASRMSVEDSTESLTSLLNQFKLSYKDAGRVVNKLSSGEDIGASTITESTDLVRQFASSARMAGADLEETIALIQSTTKTLGKEGVGKGFRNLMVDFNTGKGMDKNKLRALSMVGADINKIIAPSTKFIDKLREVKKLLSDKQAMGMFFKKTGFETGATFLESFKQFETYLEFIRKNNTATEKATKNNRTFAKSYQDLRNSFTNFVATGGGANAGLETMKSLMNSARENIGALTNGVVLLTGSFLALKAFFVGAKIFTTVIGWMRAYRLATILATRANVGFLTSIVAGTAPLSAMILPILGIAAAAGLAGYALYKFANRNKTAADKQVEAIMKTNRAVTSSTNHLKTELQKQLDLRLNHLKLIEQVGNKPLSEAAKKYNFVIRSKKNEITAENDKAIKDALERRRKEASIQLGRLNSNGKHGRNYTTAMWENTQLQRLPKGKAQMMLKGGMTFEDIEKLHKSLVTVDERRQQLEIIINDKGNVVDGVKLDGKNYFNGIPAKTSSTTGIPNLWVK